MSKMERNFYEILNAAPNATLEELKSNYKHLILQNHPDKLLQQQQYKNRDANKLENDLKNEEFVVISEAWNCLKDPLKRKQYDAELLLNKFHTHNNIYAHIQLSEMKKCLNTDVNVELVDSEVEDEEETTGGREGLESTSNKESSSYFYTYDCRCGGQYIVDESAEQYCRKVNSTAATADVVVIDGRGGGEGDFTVDDGNDDDDNCDDDADFTQNNNSPNKTDGYKNGGTLNDGGRDGVDGSVAFKGVAFDEDNDEGDSDNELIVECSECSLVIILNG